MTDRELTTEAEFLGEMSKRIILKIGERKMILDLLEKEEYIPAAIEGIEELSRRALTPEFFFLSFVACRCREFNEQR